MRICSLKEVSHIAQQQAAALMVVRFAEHWPAAWPDLDSAMRTVDEASSDNRICRAAVDDDGEVVGWAAAEPLYNGNVWELTALVVNPSRQRQGIGRFWWRIWKERVREWGGLTIWLGSDDEGNMTMLAGVNLYPDPLEHLVRISNRRGHPFEFYRKMGFLIAGVLPDANGLGKPDIFLAKSVARR